MSNRLISGANVEMISHLALLIGGASALQLRPRCGHVRCAGDYEAKNPLISLLGTLLPSKGGEAQQTAVDALADIDWESPKARGLSTEQMAGRIDTGLRERGWFVTGRGMPELFSDSFRFSDPDVQLDGYEPYCRQVRRLFNQETSAMEVVCAAATGPRAITVVWRLSGGVNLGAFGVAIKPYVVTTTLETDADGLVSAQEDHFSIPGYDILLSALLPPLRPLLQPEAPPVSVLASRYDPLTCEPLAPTASDEEEPGVATKGVWFATEAFGKLAAAVKGPPPPPPPPEPPPKESDP